MRESAQLQAPVSIWQLRGEVDFERKAVGARRIQRRFHGATGVYHQDITGWLERTLEDIQAPNVREIVSQYRDLVHQL